MDKGDTHYSDEDRGGSVMYKILIAEDETEMKKLLVKYINREEPDLEVVGSASNGKEALALTEEKHPDIVLTDISMPVLDGLGFLEETVKRKIPLKAVIISGYDEFEYARKAIALGVSDYLLKPFEPEELKSVLEKIKGELDRQKIFLNNMQMLKEKANENETALKEQILRDIIIEGKQIVERSDPLLLDTESDFYCVALLKMPLCPASKVWEIEKRENVEELVKILRDGCLPRGIEVHGLGLENNGVALIMNGYAPEKQQFFYKLKKGLEHFQNSMEKYYDIQLICILGRVYQAWDGLAASYREAIQEWRGLSSSNRKMIVCGEKKDENSSGEEDLSRKIKNLKDRIILSVQMGQEKNSIEYLDELFQVYASISPKKIDFVAISAEELVYMVFNEIEKRDIRLDKEKSNDEIQKKIKERLHNASLLEIKEVLRQYFSVCHRSFSENQEKRQTDRLVESVKNLIEDNLDYEDLTLEWIAERMHFSSTYIRQIFKQKTSERIMEYVIRKRMERAGRLLMETDMKIQEITEMCGYSNQRYFASSFKKYYDCTPTDFKKMVNKDQTGKENRKDE